MHETTALGAAIAAAFAIGVWKDFADLKHMNRANRATFNPAINKKASTRMYTKWSKAVEMSRGWMNERPDESDDDNDDDHKEADVDHKEIVGESK